jgi:hypothetical protein
MQQALAHVALKSSGGPIDPDLRVTLNFHPDRLAMGVPIMQALGRDRLYRSQFETGTSNGGLTAYHGGDRWSWESRMFGRPRRADRQGGVAFGQAVRIEPAGRFDHLVQARPPGTVPQ